MEASDTSVQHLIATNVSWSLEDTPNSSTNLRVELRGIRGAAYQRESGRPVHIAQDLQRMIFTIPASTRLFPSLPTRNLETAALLRETRPDARVELARRFALPVASAALLLLGIALGLGHPRFQRGGALVKSLAAIMLYYLALKFFENQLTYGKLDTAWPLYLLPWATLGLAFWLLESRLKPHRASRLRRLLPATPLHRLAAVSRGPLRRMAAIWYLWKVRLRHKGHREARCAVLSCWTRRLWWNAWGGTLATMLVLSLLVEYANLAGEISKYHVSPVLFLRYWIWNLPPFLSVALPVAFLLGGVLAFSEAAVSREWVALRAGGVSLLRWVLAGWRGWGLVLLLGMIIPVWIEPMAYTKADNYYRAILNRSPKASGTPRWLHLGNTGVLWYLDGGNRWGFPLHAPGTAPVLLAWEQGQDRARALPWGGLGLVPGPATGDLFPDASLQRAASAEESPTLDLYRWQQWAPNPERAALLWGRLLNWLAGPVLLFGALSYAFPPPRAGRGQALGAALVLGLAYMGLQALFGGAAKSGQIPAFWGMAGPMILVAGFGLVRLRFLKT